MTTPSSDRGVLIETSIGAFWYVEQPDPSPATAARRRRAVELLAEVRDSAGDEARESGQQA